MVGRAPRLIVWFLRSSIARCHVPEDRVLAFADTPSRLQRLDGLLQERLIGWGCAVCDAALRKHVNPALAKPEGFPYSVAEV